MKWRWTSRAAIFDAIAAHAIPRSGGTYRIGSLPYEYAPMPGAREWRAEEVESGYVVGVIRGPIIPADNQDDLGSILLCWHERNRESFDKPGRAIGLWYHEGRWHIDCVQIVFSEAQAREIGASHDELAIYNIETGKTVYLEKSA